MPNLNTVRSHHREVSLTVVFVWLLSIGLVSFLSLTPRVEFPVEFRSADLVYHFLAYLWLSTLPFFGIRSFGIGSVCALMLVPLGVSLEFLQTLVPGRCFSVADMTANTTGVIFGILLGRYLIPHFSGRLQPFLQCKKF
jgi:VanZ family protein